MSAKKAAGRVRTLFIRPKARGEAVTVAEGRLLAGRGLEGDRYASGEGSFSKATRSSNLTLVAIEDLEHVARSTGVSLTPEESLRNVVTEGIDMKQLLHRRFKVGDAVCVGTRLCEPCTVLEEYTGRTGLLKPYVHRTGLRAQILETGTVKVGDRIVDAGPAEDLMETLSAPSTGRGVHIEQPDGALFCGECETPSGNPTESGEDAICLRCGMRGPIRKLAEVTSDQKLVDDLERKMDRYPYSLRDLAKLSSLTEADTRALAAYLQLADRPANLARVAIKGSSGPYEFDERYSRQALDHLKSRLGDVEEARRQYRSRSRAARKQLAAAR